MNFKQKSLFLLLIIPFTSFAGYSVNMPLETGIGGTGGNLPSSSIIFSNSGGSPSTPPPIDPSNPPTNPTNPTDTNEDPRMQACRDKQPQVISIIQGYGTTFNALRPYLDEDSNIVYCTADYQIPDDPQRDMVIQDLKNIGVDTAM